MGPWRNKYSYCDNTQWYYFQLLLPKKSIFRVMRRKIHKKELLDRSLRAFHEFKD